MPQLVIRDPKGTEQRLPLERSEYVLGRDPGTDLQLNDKKVSRRHARLFAKGPDYWIEDLGSANGVLHAGKPIRGALRLAPDIVVDVGGFVLRFDPDTVSASSPVAVAAPVPAARDAAHPETGFSLLGRTAPYLEQYFVLPQGSLDVGRTEANALAIPDPSVSRRHARLEVTAAGVLVEDLESANGTFVNNTKVGRRELRIGDRVRFGSVEFEFLRQGQVAGLSTLVRLWNRLWHLDRPMQIAFVIGLMAAFLLTATAILTVGRAKNSGRASPLGLVSPEIAYETQLVDLLHQAREQMAKQAWTEARQAFESVLEKDPIDREARRGLEEATGNLRDQQDLNAARASLDAGRSLEAVPKLQGVLQNPHYSGVAQELLVRARTTAAETELVKAREACKRGDWANCHERAILLLDLQPDSVAGQALVTEAEGNLRARRIPFTPWAPPAAPAGRAAQSLEAQYPDAETRDAVVRYAAGDFDTAVRRAQLAGTRPGAQELLSRLAEFRRAKTAADGAQNQDVERALKAWEEALSVDNRILPADHPSSFRDELQRRLGNELFKKGEAAFAKQSLAEAYQAWSSGLRYVPTMPELLGSLAKLENLAQGRLATLPAAPPFSSEQCQEFVNLMAITKGDSPSYQEANRRRQSSCR